MSFSIQRTVNLLVPILVFMS